MGLGALTLVCTIRSSPGTMTFLSIPPVTGGTKTAERELGAPCKRAAIPTMISTALPNDALSNPERVCPSFIESCSVAVPRSCG